MSAEWGIPVSSVISQPIPVRIRYTERVNLSKLQDKSFEVTVRTRNFVYLSSVVNKARLADDRTRTNIHVININEDRVVCV